MKVRQLVASYLEEGSPLNLEELTLLPWVKKFWVLPGFHQFVRTPSGPGCYLLLAEYDGGRHYMVVALLEGSEVDQLTRALPLWKGPVKGV